MSFVPVRNSVNRSMGLDRKIIGYKTSTIGELISKDGLVKNMTMEICYKVTNTNLNSIFIYPSKYMRKSI